MEHAVVLFLPLLDLVAGFGGHDTKLPYCVEREEVHGQLK